MSSKKKDEKKGSKKDKDKEKERMEQEEAKRERDRLEAEQRGKAQVILSPCAGKIRHTRCL